MSEEITTSGVLKTGGTLKSELTALRARITANRKLLTLLIEGGHGTRDQVIAFNKLYPGNSLPVPDEPDEPEEVAPPEAPAPKAPPAKPVPKVKPAAA